MTRSQGAKRPRRVNERVRQIVAETIDRELLDPRLELVTVTDVRATPDLRTATIFWTILDRRRQAEAGRALESSRAVLQRRLGQGLGTRNTPQLTFTFDDHQDRARDLTALIETLEVAPEDEAT